MSLEIRKGEILALVGESGSGKTTVARILTGMLREDAGSFITEGGSRSGDGGWIHLAEKSRWCSRIPMHR